MMKRGIIKRYQAECGDTETCIYDTDIAPVVGIVTYRDATDMIEQLYRGGHLANTDCDAIWDCGTYVISADTDENPILFVEEVKR